MKDREASVPMWGVIIPAYMEEARIGEVVRQSLLYCSHVVVVDDGSSDGTGAAAQSAGAQVLRHEVNRGKGSALNTGFEHARANKWEVVITLDADGQHDPAEIPKFMEAYQRTGIPVLIGNRMADVQGMPITRKLTNRLMSWLLSRGMGQYVPDTQCGYRLYRCDIIPFVSASSERFAAESEILLHIARRGIRMDSVRIKTIYTSNRSNIHPLVDTIRFVNMLRQVKKQERQKGIV